MFTVTIRIYYRLFFKTKKTKSCTAAASYGPPQASPLRTHLKTFIVSFFIVSFYTSVVLGARADCFYVLFCLAKYKEP